MSSLAGNPSEQSTEQVFKVEERPGELVAAVFCAMASPCELLLPAADRAGITELGRLVSEEALRVERKFSRYRDDSVVAWIHRSRGTEIVVDGETADLIDFATHCYSLSDGLFDVTSGILRRAWTFDGSDRIPEPEKVARLLPYVGLRKVRWRRPYLLLPPGMELDFGGFGKEYAVDRAFELLAPRCTTPFLINFGGDLRANRPPARGAWQIGIERPDTDRQVAKVLDLQSGALATSGDSRRFLLKDGVRYSHILNPRTGWPVTNAPRSATVAASSCTEAGLLATLAMLQGEGAREFLEAQGVRHWLLT